MDVKKTLKQYLEHLGNNDATALVELFSAQGLVFSPLYGIRPATDFYAKLAADTAESKLTYRNHFVAPDGSAALYFSFAWTLADGKKTSFECVDLFKFDDAGLITELRIIYDTHKTRGLLPGNVLA